MTACGRGTFALSGRLIQTVRLILLSLLLALAGAVAAAPLRTPHVEAELVAERGAIEPGRPLTVALRLKAIPGWHTYWRNPGDSGEPTKLAWTGRLGSRGKEKRRGQTLLVIRPRLVTAPASETVLGPLWVGPEAKLRTLF